MYFCLKRGFAALSTTLTISAVCLPAAADDYDPLDAKAVLAHAEKTAIEHGASALSDLGKRLAGAALDSYVPGISATLGLSSDDMSSTEMLAAIQADGQRTRDLLETVWNWARAQHNAQIQADYAAIEREIQAWTTTEPSVRPFVRTRLDAIVSDCVAVIAKLQYLPEVLSRLDYLHAYVTLMNLLIALEAERSELEVVAGHAYPSSGDPGAWWDALSDATREELARAADRTKRERIAGLLLPGLAISFATHLADMDAGTLVGGTPGLSDFVAARDWMFSDVRSGIPPNGLSDGTARWFYFVGRDLEPHCPRKTQYCSAYRIFRGSWNSGVGQFRYTVDFEGGSGPYYPSDYAPYEEHRELVLKDMILRGYGPVRALAEAWWDAWDLGERQRLWLDDRIDAYLEEADSRHEGALEMLAYYQTLDITPAQKSRLYGFALAEGLNAVVEIASAALLNRDYMDSATVTRFPWQVHRAAIRAYPASMEKLGLPYRAQSAAKVVATLL